MSLPKIVFRSLNIQNHKRSASEKIESLKSYRETNFSQSKSLWQYKYLTYLIRNIEYIVSTEDIDKCKRKFDSIHIFSTKKGCNCEKQQNGTCNVLCEKVFSREIQTILGYNHQDLVKFFLYNGNKTCYICNAQYTVVASTSYGLTIKRNKGIANLKKNRTKQTSIKKGGNKAKFQLDHYYPKSLYPALSISLHNLYPICGPCNQVKSNTVLDINKLHTNSKFELEEESILKFYSSESSKHLKLNVTSNDDVAKELIKKFDIEKIYENHIDYVEELLVRKIKYSDSYKDALVKRHEGLTPNFKSIEDRLIVGTYDKSEGIYKRPLSKLLQDLNDQLDNYVE